MNLITKQQIGKFVNLSENISDLDVDSFIKDATEFDTISVFPEALLTAIQTNVDAKIQQWNKNKTYAIDDIIFFETYYTSLSVNTNSQPPSADWEANELMNFYAQYLIPFIAYSFYYRFIAYHGAKIAQAGLVEMVDPNGTYQQISDKKRGEMLGDIRSKKDVWANKISKKLNDVSFTFDGVQYLPESGKSKHIKQGVRIYALGGDRKKPCSPFNDLVDL